MDKLYRSLKAILILVVSSFLFLICIISCKEKEEFIPLKIFSVDPTEALIGDTIKIAGEGFSPGFKYNHVFFSGAKTYVQPTPTSTSKTLWVPVPEGAQSGSVTVNLFNDEVVQSPPLAIHQPEIKSISVSEGFPGDSIKIVGINFRPRAKENKVRFSRVSGGAIITDLAATITSGDGTVLNVIVPDGAQTGPVSVLGIEGPEFKIAPSAILSVEPAHGKVGDIITITGQGLSTSAGALVFFGDNVNNTLLPGGTSKKLQVIVPEGAEDGAIKLKFLAQGNEIEVISKPIFEVYPSIVSMSPLNGISGMTVTINGYNFSEDKSQLEVKFNDKIAVVTSTSKRQLKVIVPPGTSTGPVNVTSMGRLAEGLNFEISSDGTPIIFGLNPSSGPVGSFVVIEGDYFSSLKDENVVQFGGNKLATIIDATTTRLTVKVPIGTLTNNVTVTVRGKTGTGPEFTVTQRALPVITSVTPPLVNRTSNFKIQGVNFTTFKEDITVRVGVINVPVVSSTATEVVATIPSDAAAGEQAVTISQYNQSSNNDKTITISGQPQITLLSATEGFPGSQLTLTGIDFHNLENGNIVKFGGTTAALVNESDASISTIRVYVPNIVAGQYEVTVTAFGNTSNAIIFSVKEKPAAVKNVYYSLFNIQVSDGIGGMTPGIRLEKALFDPPTTQTVYERTAINPQLRALAVDIGASKAYFSLGTNTNSIARCNLDNTGYQELFATGAGAANTVNDISLDVANNNIYWSQGKDIFRGGTNGTSASVIYSNASATAINGLTYSPLDDKIYLCERIGTTMSIVRINSNGTGRTELFPVTSSPFPWDIKVDVVNEKIYLLCSSSVASNSNTRSILSGNLNGTGSLVSFHSITAGRLSGLALDIQDQYVYWITTSPETGIYRKRYNGSSIPGTDPPVSIQKVYSVVSQSNAIYTGLGVEDNTGRGLNQRIQITMSLEFMIPEQ